MLKNKVKLFFIFLLFGTIGIITKHIPLSSYALVFYRALLGGIFIFSIAKITKKEFRSSLIKKYMKTVFVAGVMMGFNWAFLFMAIKASSVSVATVCYNSSPIFMIIIALFMIKEKLNLKNIVCILIGMIGLFFVSNVLEIGFNIKELLGVIYGLIGACLYGLVVIFNKKLNVLNSYEKISIEFMVASMIMLPFVILDKNSSFLFGATENYILSFILLMFLCVFITGYIYIVYFDCVNVLPTKTVAIFTYIDPVFALFLSNIILKEKLNKMQMMGTILILIATLINEFFDEIKHNVK